MVVITTGDAGLRYGDGYLSGVNSMNKFDERTALIDILFWSECKMIE